MGIVAHSSVGFELTQEEYEGNGAHTIDGSTVYTVVTTTGSPTFTTTVTASASLIASSSASVSGMLTAKTGRGATYIIAGANADAVVRGQADVVCDGTADNIEIQAGIASLTAGRTWIETVKLIGDFSISATITGADYTRLDLTEAYLLLAASADCDMLDFSDAYDCEIFGGRLNGNKANTTAGSGIVIDDCQIMRISKAYVYGFSEYGIKMNNGTGSTQSQLWITDSNVSTCENWGIYIYGNGTPGYSSDCHISRCKLSTNYGGIYVYKMEYFDIDGCHVSDSVTSVGLYIRDSGSGVVHGGMYLRNVSNGRGIWVGNSQRIVLDGIFFEANVDGSDNEQDLYIDGTSHDITVTGCNLDPKSTATGYVKAIYVDTGAYNISVVGNDVADFWTCTAATNLKPIYVAPPVGKNVLVANNAGYIAQGEHRTKAGALTAGTNGSVAFYWNSPPGQDILIKRVCTDITTASTDTGACIDIGIADSSSGTNLGVEFFDNLPTDATGINCANTMQLCEDSTSATDAYVVGLYVVDDSTKLVGSYSIEYQGR